MAFEKCSVCGEMVASLKRHFCMGKSSGGRSDEAKAREAEQDVGAGASGVGKDHKLQSQAGVGSERTSLPGADLNMKNSTIFIENVGRQFRKKGRPRLGEVRDKPWEAAGMSERTWYRRQKEQKEGGR